jgi:hypothetical protein
MRRKEEEANLTKKVVPPHLNPETLKKDVDQKSI